MDDYTSLEDSLTFQDAFNPLVDIDHQLNDLRLTSDFDDAPLLTLQVEGASDESIFVEQSRGDVESSMGKEAPFASELRGEVGVDVDDDPIKILEAAIEADRPK